MEGSKSMSKAAKKNKKRKDKKTAGHSYSQTEKTQGNKSDLDPQEILDKLKRELEIAKERKDHKRAGELRDQIWVLTDVVAGVRTEIQEEELAPILQSLSLEAAGSAEDEGCAAKTAGPTTVVLPSAASDGQLKKLYKKLQQIETLKERHQKGEKLEANQLEKIKKEEEIRKEITGLEQIIQDVCRL